MNEKVPGHAGLTYFDLMKLVITDLAPGTKSGHALVPFRHIEGKDSKTAAPDAPSIESLDAIPIPGDRSRLVLLADLGHTDEDVTEVVLLCLFVLEPSPKLLDVVEVGSDRFTGFQTTSLPMLAPRAPLILIWSGHNNSNESYQFTEMIFIRNERFSLIDTLFLFDERFCAFERTHTASFGTLPDPGPYRAVHVAVQQVTKPSGEDCGDEKSPPPRHKIYQATYRWDTGKQDFVAGSHELDALGKANWKRATSG
ncbi:MAG TPA: hypothetical protein VGR45_13325 [Stellaceae bacterium]|nr:hypothetical protein [Stellaceae bacterium]